jgi:hypothetical protein
MDRQPAVKSIAEKGKSAVNDGGEEAVRDDAAVWREDTRREALPKDREHEKRPVQAPWRPSRRALRRAERGVAARRKVKGGTGATHGGQSAIAPGGKNAEEGRLKTRHPYLEDTLAVSTAAPPNALSATERTALEARYAQLQEHQESVYEQLLLDAQACARAMRPSPSLDGPAAWQDIVSSSLDDHRSGHSLMHHLGAARLLDPATTGMLLAIRRGLIEENNATSMVEYVLIDMAIVAFANAMRLQSIVGNTSLVIEGEMFGQPALRAKWGKTAGGRSEIQGLAIDEHVAKLRDTIMPLVASLHRMGRESVEALGRMRQAPSANVELAAAVKIILAHRSNSSAQ